MSSDLLSMLPLSLIRLKQPSAVNRLGVVVYHFVHIYLYFKLITNIILSAFLTTLIWRLKNPVFISLFDICNVVEYVPTCIVFCSIVLIGLWMFLLCCVAEIPFRRWFQFLSYNQSRFVAKESAFTSVLASDMVQHTFQWLDIQLKT